MCSSDLRRNGSNTTTTTAATLPALPVVVTTVAPTLPPVAPTLAPTTIAPTTTAAPPVPTMSGTWLLASSSPGDVASTAVLGFAQRDALNAGPVNLDTDRDSVVGRTIVKGGWTYFGSTTKVQRFAYDPGTAFTINGRITLDLWAAPASGQDEKVKIVAVLAKCDDSGTVCLPVKDDSESFKGDAGTFELVTLDFGNRTVQVGQAERFELWVFANDGSDADLMFTYDTAGTASALKIS